MKFRNFILNVLCYSSGIAILLLLFVLFYSEFKYSSETIGTTTTVYDNIYNGITMVRSDIDPSLAGIIANSIKSNAKEYGIPPFFIVAMINRESEFNPMAKSKAGAIGLMQIIPKYHKESMDKLGIDQSKLFHIDNNIKLGCYILKTMYDGNIVSTLYKYVGSENNNYVLDIVGTYADIHMKLRKFEKDVADVPDGTNPNNKEKEGGT